MGNIPALTEVEKVTRVEQKALRQEQKQTLKKLEVSSSEDSDEETEGELDLPSAFKSYTIQDRNIILQKQKCQIPLETRESYEGPKDVKQVDLAKEGEEPRLVWNLDSHKSHN